MIETERVEWIVPNGFLPIDEQMTDGCRIRRVGFVSLELKSSPGMLHFFVGSRYEHLPMLPLKEYGTYWEGAGTKAFEIVWAIDATLIPFKSPPESRFLYALKPADFVKAAPSDQVAASWAKTLKRKPPVPRWAQEAERAGWVSPENLRHFERALDVLAEKIDPSEDYLGVLLKNGFSHKDVEQLASLSMHAGEPDAK